VPTTSLEPLSSEVRELVGADGVPDMRQKAPCIRLGKLPHDFRHAVGALPLVYCGASRDDRWNHLGMWLVLTKIGHALSGPLAYISRMPAYASTQGSLYAGLVPQPVNHAHETGPTLTDGYSYMSLPRRP
jgi:hypothetical protein